MIRGKHSTCVSLSMAFQSSPLKRNTLMGHRLLKSGREVWFKKKEPFGCKSSLDIRDSGLRVRGVGGVGGWANEKQSLVISVTTGMDVYQLHHKRQPRGRVLESSGTH